MEEKIADLLAQYDLAVHRAGRVKGSWMLETDRGLKCLGGCSYSEGKIKFEQRVKEFAAEKGFTKTDLYVPNREQNYLVQGPYNEMFVMRNWFYGEECNTGNREQMIRSAKALAALHNCLRGFVLSEEEKEFSLQPKLPELFEKRNKELRRVRTYIRSKKQKSPFEQSFLSRFEALFAHAEEATKALDTAEYETYYCKQIEEGTMLHGNYTHHSVLFLQGDDVAVTGFDKTSAGIQIQDFYLLFRKVMEKWEWDTSLGDELLNAYHAIRPVPKEEGKFLKQMLLYPEKFWKVANQYYNNRKSWIPEKNMQKLIQTMNQMEKKTETINSLFT